jgi:type IV pilus assembly protein PilV
MWTDRANLANYQHRPTGGGTSCDPTGADSPSATVAGSNMKTWLDIVSAALPGAASQRQQILVAAGNEVTITICWKAPQETSWHNYILITHIN